MLASLPLTHPRQPPSPLCDPFRLDGEIALITGGGSGLGLGMATCLSAAGARVVLVGRREAPLAAAAQALPGATYLVQDITELDRAGELVNAAEARAGGAISILINNAGLHLKKKAVDTSWAELESVLRAHVYAAHALSRAVLPGMLARRHGSLLFIASMASFLGVPGVLAYAAAKSAYLGMVRTLAAEVSPEGVRVNAIAPGWIDSPMTQKALDSDPERKQRVITRTPAGRLGAPEDIGWAAVYLSSPAAKFVTGCVLPVDGGAATGF